jgi:hypothetical protein
LFQTPEFLKLSDTSTFTQKFVINKAIVLLQTKESFSDEAIQLLLLLLLFEVIV